MLLGRCYLADLLLNSAHQTMGTIQQEIIWHVGNGKGWNQKNARRRSSERKIVRVLSQKQKQRQGRKLEWLSFQDNYITVNFHADEPQADGESLLLGTQVSSGQGGMGLKGVWDESGMSTIWGLGPFSCCFSGTQKEPER